LIYEFEELKVHLGEQVQAGQLLCQLANHTELYIEGRAFEQDAPLVQRAMEHAWPVRAQFLETGSKDPTSAASMASRSAASPGEQHLKILYLSNKVDPATRTFPFYIPLLNEFAQVTGENGKTYLLWRYRPGQRVRLSVQVGQVQDAQAKGVFVLPTEAVARDGPETYVFLQSGDLFKRRPVHVLHEAPGHVVIANDGSINVGNYLAQNGAAQLLRALKAQASGGGHGHHHHGHDH
jgi:multidrug efflux pump subunit AcrA (membrane-fusion protein)